MTHQGNGIQMSRRESCSEPQLPPAANFFDVMLSLQHAKNERNWCQMWGMDVDCQRMEQKIYADLSRDLISVGFWRARIHTNSTEGGETRKKVYAPELPETPP